MRGLIRKDLLLMRASFSWGYALSIAVIVLALWGNPSLLELSLPIVLTFLYNSAVLSTFAHDEKCSWATTLHSLPVTARAAAASKMVVLSGGLLCILVLSLACSASLDFLGGPHPGIVAGALLGVVLVVLYDMVLFPVTVLFGYSKNQIATFVFAAVIVLVLHLVQTGFINHPAPASLQSSGAIWVLAAVLYAACSLATVFLTACALERA